MIIFFVLCFIGVFDPIFGQPVQMQINGNQRFTVETPIEQFTNNDVFSLQNWI